MGEGDEAESALVMPFVAVASVGGPYEDDAYAAGYEAGLCAGRMEAHRAPESVTVRTENVPQIDLLAMQHGYRCSVTEWPEDPSWSSLLLTSDS